MSDYFKSKSFVCLKVNLPSLREVLEELQDFVVECSRGGNSTECVERMKLIDFLQFEHDNLYVFHNSFSDRKMFEVLKRLIPLSNISQLRISRLYIGNEGTGSHIHNHSFAMNYLISGRKLWIIFPKTLKNIQYLKRNHLEYLSIQDDGNPLNWFLTNQERLVQNLDSVQIKIQEKGEVFIIPDGMYHGVYNLTKVCGITYSWY